MDALLVFAKGPLFRLTFAIMVLGLARNIILVLYGIGKSYWETDNRNIPYGYIAKRTLTWLFPIQQIFRVRPVYSLISVLFHVGLILVPIFLYAHISLWKSSLGFGWPALSKIGADILTISTIAGAFLLFFGRLINSGSRTLSSLGDYLWPLLLSIPFISGFFCVHTNISPLSYHSMLLIHILSAELIFVLIPFSKIAHCVLVPFSQIVSDMDGGFPAIRGIKWQLHLAKKELQYDWNFD